MVLSIVLGVLVVLTGLLLAADIIIDGPGTLRTRIAIMAACVLWPLTAVAMLLFFVGVRVADAALVIVGRRR